MTYFGHFKSILSCLPLNVKRKFWPHPLKLLKMICSPLWMFLTPSLNEEILTILPLFSKHFYRKWNSKLLFPYSFQAFCCGEPSYECCTAFFHCYCKIKKGRIILKQILSTQWIQPSLSEIPIYIAILTIYQSLNVFIWWGKKESLPTQWK